jgi:hypothetical protein
MTTMGRHEGVPLNQRAFFSLDGYRDNIHANLRAASLNRLLPRLRVIYLVVAWG